MAKAELCLPKSAIRRFTWVTDPDIGRLVFFVFLAVLPVLFSTETLENFEYPKSMWLRACMLCYLAPVLVKARSYVTRVGTDKNVHPTEQAGLAAILGRAFTLLKTDLMAAGVLLFAASAVLSTLMSLNPRISWWGEHTSYAGLATILAHVIVFFVARALGNSVMTMERLLSACLLAGVVAAVFAFLQMGGVDPVGWQFPSDAGGFPRPFGTLGHPNHLGAFLAMVFPLAWYFASPPRRWAMMILGLVLIAGMAVALSRAAWLGWAVSTIVLAAVLVWRSWQNFRSRRMVWFVLSSLVVVVLIGWWNPRGIVSGFHDRLANLNSGLTRVQIWATSLDIFRAHPIVGTGPDIFQLAFAPRRTPSFWKLEWNTTPTRAHNELVQVLATQGTVGALALLVFLLGLAQAGRRALHHPAPDARRLALALVCGVVVFLVVSLFSFSAIGFGAVFMVLAAFLSRLGERPAVSPICHPSKQDNSVAWFRPALWLGGTLIFLQFVWNLSYGLSALSGSFWLAILTMSLTLAGMAYLLGTALGSPLTDLNHCARFGGIPARRASEAPRWRVGLVLRDMHADLDSSFVSTTMNGERRTENGESSWLFFGAITAVGVAMVFLVIFPWLAHVACARGELKLADNPGQALEDFERAVSLDPWWDIYWTKLARGRQWMAAKTANPLERQALLRGAQAAWEHLTRHSPLNGAHHDNQGQCLALLCQGGLVRPEEVFASFEKAITLDPSNPLFYADAADAALRLGRNDRAWEFAWAGVRDQFQCGSLYGQIGYLLLQRDLLPDAVHYLEESLAGLWDDHEDWKGAAEANLIAAYHRTGDYQKLEKLASRFLPNRSGMPAIRALLADAQEKQGNLQGAYENYRLVLEQAPGHRLARAGYERLRAANPILPASWKKTVP